MMILKRLALSTAILLGGVSAGHAAPKVVVSIKPIHSLVASVMEGVGEPGLIVEGAGSPHTYALKPSQAQTIENADLVFWVGHLLETFLDKPLDSLGANANVIELGDLPGLTLLNPRSGGAFEKHQHHGEEGDHDHAEEGHDHDEDHDRAAEDHDHDHAAEDHDHDGDHDHAAEAEDHDHEEDHDEHEHEHEHGSTDPHLWLDPENARAMLPAIADALAAADPENAETYKANAEKTAARLTKLEGELNETLAPAKGEPFIVFHDAYQYFENRFGLTAVGSITVSPEVAPGAERVAAMHHKVEETGAKCVFSEPQFEPKIVSVVIEGSDAHSGVLDPLGAKLTPGPNLYFDVLANLAASIRDCIGR